MPIGDIVPNLWMMWDSVCFRSKESPCICHNPLTFRSMMMWLAKLKCCATGLLWLWQMSARCSVKHITARKYPTWLLMRHSNMSSRSPVFLPSGYTIRHQQTNHRCAISSPQPSCLPDPSFKLAYPGKQLQICDRPLPPLSPKKTSNFATFLWSTLRKRLGPTTLGTFHCTAAICTACPYLCADISVQGPNGHMQIRRSFTCQSDNLVNLITCQTCGMMYVGETALVTRFAKHFADIHHNRSKPVV